MESHTLGVILPLSEYTVNKTRYLFTASRYRWTGDNRHQSSICDWSFKIKIKWYKLSWFWTKTQWIYNSWKMSTAGKPVWLFCECISISVKATQTYINCHSFKNSATAFWLNQSFLSVLGTESLNHYSLTDTEVYSLKVLYWTQFISLYKDIEWEKKSGKWTCI